MIDWQKDCKEETEMNEWINVKDRMPLDDESVINLVTVIAVNKYDGVLPLEYERAEVRGKTIYRWRYLWNRIYAGEQITHWMPLPEPPKDDIC